MIPEFALRLICGLSSAWCLAPREKITSGFFRIQMLIVLGLSVLAIVTSNQLPATGFSDPGLFRSIRFGLGLVLAFLAFSGSISWTLERRVGGTLFALLILLFSVTGLVEPLLWEFRLSSQSLWRIGDALTAAWELGATTAAMLLGHWYLTATGMSLTPLLQYTRIFGISVFLRMLFVIAATCVHSELSAANWTLVTLRWAGLAGPLILAVLTLQILRYRNTQSATGVLYAATILVFMGEMADALMAGMQAT